VVWLAGVIGVCADAGAQVPSGAAGFDGTYALVSSVKVNQTYTSRGGATGFCPERAPGPLVIAQGRAQYTGDSGLRVNGTVGPRGELAMESTTLARDRAVEVRVAGQVDRGGTVRARQLGNSCSYDLVWQKRS
jgi:hypothetical protein